MKLTPLRRDRTNVYTADGSWGFSVANCPEPERLAELIVTSVNANRGLIEACKGEHGDTPDWPECLWPINWLKTLLNWTQEKSFQEFIQSQEDPSSIDQMLGEINWMRNRAIAALKGIRRPPTEDRVLERLLEQAPPISDWLDEDTFDQDGFINAYQCWQTRVQIELEKAKGSIDDVED